MLSRKNGKAAIVAAWAAYVACFHGCVALNAPVDALYTRNPASTSTTGATAANTTGSVAWSTPSVDGRLAVLSNYTAYPVAGTCLTTGATAITLTNPGGTVTASTTCIAGNWNTTLDFSGVVDGNVVMTATQGVSTANRTINRQVTACDTRPGSTPVGQFADGDGTVGDPWIICTLADLGNISANLTGGNNYLKLQNNISVGGAFTPITGMANSDDFDGQSLTISNVTLNAGAFSTGLFDLVSGSAYIHDLVLSAFTVNNGSGTFGEGVAIAVGYLTGTARVANITTSGTITYDPGNGVQHFIGSIVGYGDSTYAPYGVLGCSSSATITAVNTNNIGGLAGHLETGINNSYTTGDISGHGATGGLVGRCNAAIDNSYATGNVSLSNAAGGFGGGLVAAAITAGCVISNSYATGTVSNTFSAAGSSSAVGGLVGGCSANITITNSYATGAVNAPGSDNVGGLVGALRGSVSNSYATGNVSGHYAVGGFIGINLSASTATDCYSRTGSVTAANNAAGGFVGDGTNLTATRAYSNGAVTNAGGSTGGFNGTATTSCTNCFWNTVTSTRGTSPDGTGLNAAQSIISGNYTGFSFPATWKMDAALSTYPSLSWQ